MRAVGAEVRLVRGDPADGRVARVVGIPTGIGRPVLHHDRVGVADMREGVVPSEDAAPDRLSVFRWDLVGEIERDRSVVEIPAIDEPFERCRRRVVPEPFARGDEVAHAVVGVARHEARIALRRGDDAVVHHDRDAAPVGDGRHRVGRSVESQVDADLVVAREGLGPAVVRLRRVDRERRVHGKAQPRERGPGAAAKIGADAFEIGHEDARRDDRVLVLRILGDDR